MKSLTDQELELITEMSYLLFPPKLIAINLEVDEEEFVQQVNDLNGNVVRSAFYKGYIKQLMELRRSIVKAAGNGSNPAQEQLLSELKRLNNLLEQ